MKPIFSSRPPILTCRSHVVTLPFADVPVSVVFVPLMEAFNVKELPAVVDELKVNARICGPVLETVMSLAKYVAELLTPTPIELVRM